MRMLAKGFAGQVHMGRDVVFDTHTKQREKQSWTGHCTVLPQSQFHVPAASHSILESISNESSKKNEKMSQKLE